jgi:hypothetical protein
MEDSMKSILLTGILLMMGLIAGCSKETPVQTERILPPAQGPGTFGMSHLKGLAKTTASTLAKTTATTGVKSGENVNFNLGNIKGSTAFYFLLYNIGATAITNVKLHISDSSFDVYPASIDTLIPGGDVGMLPVVKVSAYHGSALDGIGARPVMPKGENIATLSIEGTTKTVNGIDTVVQLAAGLKLTALVMDIEVRTDSEGIIDLTQLSFSQIGGKSIDGFDVGNMRGYNIVLNNRITIINTGNVAIDIGIYYEENMNSSSSNHPMSNLLNKKIQPGDSIQTGLTEQYQSLYFSLDGGNVVAANNRKLRIDDNGLCYFFFSHFVFPSPLPPLP